MKFTIHGKVQGVGFRQHLLHFVRKEIPCVLGSVRNLSNGDVEVVAAIHSENDYIALVSYLKKGPKLACVESFLEEEIEEIKGLEKFLIKH